MREMPIFFWHALHKEIEYINIYDDSADERTPSLEVENWQQTKTRRVLSPSLVKGTKQAKDSKDIKVDSYQTQHISLLSLRHH